MDKKEYDEEFIQAKIDQAVANANYYDVTAAWTKVSVIGGAKRRWEAEAEDVSEDDHFVYAPGGRLCGPQALVIAVLDKFNIDDKTLYTSVESPGYKEELDEYKKTSTTGGLLDDEAFKALKASIKKDNGAPTLKSMIRELGVGKVVNVTDIKEGKFSTVNAPLATTLSQYVCIPGLAIASKSEEAFVEALSQLEVAQEKRDDYVAAFQALSKFKKVPVAKEKKAPKASAAAKKTTPAKASSSAKPSAAAKKSAPAKASASAKKSAPAKK